MTTTFRRTLASAAAATALLASFALPSYAQTAAPAAPAAATTPKPERPMHKPGERREHMQQRIAKLKADLHEGFGDGTSVADIVVVEYTVAPGGYFGWHRHGGPVWVISSAGAQPTSRANAGLA